MTLVKTQFIRDLVPNQPVGDLFVVASARQAQAKNGPFWLLTLQDATGQIGGKIWSPRSQDYENIEAGQVVFAEGRAGQYNGQVDLSVDSLRFFDPEDPALPITDLVPSSKDSPEDLLARLEEICRRNLHYPPWRKLMRLVFGDEEVRRRLLRSTGGKAIHHAYVGGLLEHTLSVVRLVNGICDQYTFLDREILTLAAAFHDIGKAWELSQGVACDYTDEGRLLGHILMGIEKLDPFLREAGVDDDLVMHLKHILASHHGEYEYGSPKRPKTAEAMVMHYADNLDSKLNQFECLFGETDEAAEESGWSPYQRSLERFLFKARPTPGNGVEKKPEENRKVSQCSLPLKA